MMLSSEDREWLGLMLEDALNPYGKDFDAVEATRLIEARLRALIRRHRTAAWDEGAASRQCHCAAYYDGECACGGYPSESNPYRER